MLITTSPATAHTHNSRSLNLEDALDFVPIVSTCKNLFHLFEKAVIACLPANCKLNGYYTHIKNKSTLKCALLLIPIIGNIIAYYLIPNTKPSIPTEVREDHEDSPHGLGNDSDASGEHPAADSDGQGGQTTADPLDQPEPQAQGQAGSSSFLIPFSRTGGERDSLPADPLNNLRAILSTLSEGGRVSLTADLLNNLWAIQSTLPEGAPTRPLTLYPAINALDPQTQRQFLLTIIVSLGLQDQLRELLLASPNGPSLSAVGNNQRNRVEYVTGNDGEGGQTTPYSLAQLQGSPSRPRSGLDSRGEAPAPGSHGQERQTNAASLTQPLGSTQTTRNGSDASGEGQSGPTTAHPEGAPAPGGNPSPLAKPIDTNPNRGQRRLQLIGYTGLATVAVASPPAGLSLALAFASYSLAQRAIQGLRGIFEEVVG
jgi:hypothetical protein